MRRANIRKTRARSIDLTSKLNFLGKNRKFVWEGSLVFETFCSIVPYGNLVDILASMIDEKIFGPIRCRSSKVLVYWNFGEIDKQSQ